MIWTGMMVILGTYIGLVIAGKNPTVGEAVLRFHEKTTAWVYKWAPILWGKVVK